MLPVKLNLEKTYKDFKVIKDLSAWKLLINYDGEGGS